MDIFVLHFLKEFQIKRGVVGYSVSVIQLVRCMRLTYDSQMISPIIIMLKQVSFLNSTFYNSSKSDVLILEAQATTSLNLRLK